MWKINVFLDSVYLKKCPQGNVAQESVKLSAYLISQYVIWHLAAPLLTQVPATAPGKCYLSLLASCQPLRRRKWRTLITWLLQAFWTGTSSFKISFSLFIFPCLSLCLLKKKKNKTCEIHSHLFNSVVSSL